jgi:hypothetical protein
LTIQLYAKFGFGHRTSKPDIFDHPTVKTVQIWPSGGFIIQLSKPFKFGHRVVLIGGFQFFYLQFGP